MNQVNITFFDLPLLAAPGGVAFGIWDPWTDYALAFYGTQVPFTSGGYGFSGTWYASPSYDGVVAEENFGTSRNDLYIHKIYADGGPTRKWRRFGARGRFKPWLRRSSHITVILREREEL